MKKLAMCAILGVMMPLAVSAQTQKEEMKWLGMDALQSLHGSVSVTYQFRYIWRGFDVYQDDKGAMQYTANLDLFGSGFGIAVAGHRSTDNAYRNAERWDYNAYYQNSLWSGETFATNYRIGFVHYNYSKLYARQLDLEEMHAILSWPSVTGVKGLVPSYVLVKLWPAYKGSTGVGGNASGFAHIFMVDYSFAVPGVTADTPEQVFKLHSELVYNDGVSPRNTDVDHQFSNAVFGISTDIDLGAGFTLTPAGFYQISMDSSVNPENELWGTLGLRYSF